ncbi:MAG: hypothetical protein WBQ73_03115, partial [Candidatus Babeliales bacterium]
LTECFEKKIIKDLVDEKNAIKNKKIFPLYDYFKKNHYPNTLFFFEKFIADEGKLPVEPFVTFLSYLKDERDTENLNYLEASTAYNVLSSYLKNRFFTLSYSYNNKNHPFTAPFPLHLDQDEYYHFKKVCTSKIDSFVKKNYAHCTNQDNRKIIKHYSEYLEYTYASMIYGRQSIQQHLIPVSAPEESHHSHKTPLAGVIVIGFRNLHSGLVTFIPFHKDIFPSPPSICIPLNWQGYNLPIPVAHSQSNITLHLESIKTAPLYFVDSNNDYAYDSDNHPKEDYLLIKGIIIKDNHPRYARPVFFAKSLTLPLYDDIQNPYPYISRSIIEQCLYHPLGSSLLPQKHINTITDPKSPTVQRFISLLKTIITQYQSPIFYNKENTTIIYPLINNHETSPASEKILEPYHDLISEINTLSEDGKWVCFKTRPVFDISFVYAPVSS